MPYSRRSNTQLNEEEKKKRRREQKKLSMRRARANLDDVALEERRRKDRERYHRKKKDGLIRTIKDFTPRQQRQLRKMWREKAKLRREKDKIRKHAQKVILENTPPSSPCSSRSSFSRIAAGKVVRARNRRLLRAQNVHLIKKLNVLEKALAKYRMRLTRIKKNKQSRVEHIKFQQKIRDFLLDDENSRLTAGKKETITRKKEKKQIRLLNDTLLNLHKKFNNTTGLTISYETFRRNRPFWVLFPKTTSRNTCLCSVHANNDYIARALHQAKIISYASATDVAKSLCCDDTLNIPCLERTCQRCFEKTPSFSLINGNDTIIYPRWVTKTVTDIIKGKERKCKKTIKEIVKTSQQSLVNILTTKLPLFMQHLANIINQYRAVRFIKQNLTPSEGLLHIDFSENYCCKYESEVQSAHFGGSKSQLSLHTCVYYSTDSQPPQNFLKTTSMCTVSNNLRHDPVLICAHLKPVIENIRLISPDLKTLHILSDGPTTQYRNKTMFHMIVNYLSKISNTDTIVWHFSEAGHGKGAPDGVGGCVKRTCDNAVANGRDVSNIDSFISCIKHNCKNIEIIHVDDSYISEIQHIADANKCNAFKGTLKIHQIIWNITEPNILHVRRLSCTLCSQLNCPHFEIGQIYVEYVSDLSSTSSPSLPSPDSSHGTASESTVTGPRTPYSLTPSPARMGNITPQSFIPKKKIHFDTNNTDDSMTPPKRLKKTIKYFQLSDSDEDIFN